MTPSLYIVSWIFPRFRLSFDKKEASLRKRHHNFCHLMSCSVVVSKSVPPFICLISPPGLERDQNRRSFCKICPLIFYNRLFYCLFYRMKISVFAIVHLQSLLFNLLACLAWLLVACCQQYHQTFPLP